MPKAKVVEPEPEEEEPEPEIEEGNGTFLYPDGSKYEGDWRSVDGLRFRQGRGKFTTGPESYEGDWNEDVMEGQEGTYTFSSGAVYTGGFINNAFEGQGTYTFADGAVYTGGWSNGKMHGDGEYVDVDGVIWSGKFFNGMYDSGRSYISLRPAPGLV
mmetsp:Transcript_29398/g.54436  ORF Transcript_29398/g.54436 Transcript_29398/m.54436 type:complete len:157 (-) Transcript_29398:187-657(-)